MPFARPPLSQLKMQVAQDLATELEGSDPLLRHSNLNITGKVQANMANLQYGYLDWIAKQAVPFTAGGPNGAEYIQGWAALKNVFLKEASQATGTATFTGTDGRTLDIGTPLVRGDGVTYTTTSSGTVAGSSVTVSAIADADPEGLTGAFGNCDAGTVLTLGTTIAGIQSNGVAASDFTGGADLEDEDSFRSRMLGAYQAGAVLGRSVDYVTWAEEVAGVTRAWCKANGMGGGTVVVYFMMDISQAAHGGFPQGSNGVAAAEDRDVVATGDQLAVANFIYTKQTNTALVYSVAPLPATQNFTISGLTGASTGTKNAIAAAISDVFVREGSPVQDVVELSDIEAAIAAVPLTSGFVITQINGGAPGNITPALGYLPVLGTVAYP